MTNETCGNSVESALMQYYNIDYTEYFTEDRYSLDLINKIAELVLPRILREFTHRNIKIIEYQGSNGGLHDFILAGNKTLSVKSNKHYLEKVCPQVIGQSTTLKLFEYIMKHFPDMVDSIPDTKEERLLSLKRLVYDNIDVLIKEYYKQLFSSDYLLYVYNCMKSLKKETEDALDYFILPKDLLDIDFKPEYLEFNKPLSHWSNSITLRYRGVPLGEFQADTKRDNLKFRFNMRNLVKLSSFKLDNVALYNLDAFEFMKKIPDKSVDLIVIDPPYQISRETNFKSRGKNYSTNKKFDISFQFGAWDKKNQKNFIKKIIKESYRVLKKSGTIICFYDLWKISELRDYLEKENFKQLRFGEWIKTNPVPINSKINYLTNSREIFVTAVKGNKPIFNSEYDKGIYEYPIYQPSYRFHPTQKSLPLLEDLICKHSNENDIVIDCFSGSGTTALACLKNNREFIGTEKNTNYYIQSIERLKRRND